MSLPTAIEFAYQEIEGRKVMLDLLPPPNYSPTTQQYKTLIFFHGGGLMVSNRKFYAGNLHLFTEKNWIILSVDYHLLPESSVKALQNDVKALESWLLKNHTEIGVDLRRVAISGASAGVFVGVEACNRWTTIRPKAVLSLFAMVNTSDEWYTTAKPSGTRLGPVLVDSIYEKDYVKYFEAGRTPVSADFSELTNLKERVGVFFWSLREGKYKELLATESGGVYSPLGTITAKFPPTILLHGDKDSVIPIKDSIVFLDVLQKLGVESKLLTVEGADHGLAPPAKNIGYVQEGLEFVERYV